MTAISFRPVGASFVLLALTACASPGPAAANPTPPVIGVDLGRSGPAAQPAPAALAQAQAPNHSAAHPGEKQMAHDGHAHAQGSGTVNSVDVTARKINVNHGPIPKIGWPSMTMDFAVAPSVDLRALQPGMRINFTMEQGAGGMYVIQSLTPAGGAR